MSRNEFSSRNQPPSGRRKDSLRRKQRHTRALLAESLEPRVLLATLGELEKQSLKEAFGSIAGFTANLEQSPLLNTTIPIVNKKIGELVDVDQLLRERFLAPVEKFLDGAQPTVEDFQKLFNEGFVGISALPLGKMPTLPSLANQKFSADFEIEIGRAHV